jgi:hypothetical protein
VKELGDIEMRRKAVLKTWRSMIRLKHSLAADAEINHEVAAAEKAYNNVLASEGMIPSAQDVAQEMARMASAAFDA